MSAFTTFRSSIVLAALSAVVALVAGCGGDGAGAAGSAIDASANTVAEVVLIVDKASLPAADGSTSATITALVKDSTNNVVRNQPVSFRTPDTGVSLTAQGSSGTTDTAGRVSTLLELGAGAAARTNRTVTVTARAGSIERTIDVQVAGTRMTITGPDTVNQGAFADFTVAVVDAANAGVGGVPVGVQFDRGTVSAASVTTQANGQATVRVTGTTPGAGTLRASALGLEQSKAITVVGTDAPFQFVTPASGASLAVNQDHVVRIRFARPDVDPAGKPVTITTTRGGFGGQTIIQTTTDASGEATATLRSSAAGEATLSAVVTVAPGDTSSISSRVAFVSQAAAKISLSPDPTSIGANAIGSSSSSSRLVATVRDATDNPVSGVRVAFAATDPSGGRIDPGVAVTDADGQAAVSFVAGPNSTGPDAVTVTATVVDAPAVNASRRMTVSAVALFIELGTGNSIEEADATAYRMPWSAIVTDANRNPVNGARVTVSLTAINYFKGIWIYNGSSWVPRRFDDVTEPPRQCLSEDRPRDGLEPNNLLDAGEDRNGNGRLDPGSPASVLVTSTGGTTSSDGRAQLSIVYPKSFGEWVEVRMRVTIASSGTESSVTRTFTLPVLAQDVTNSDTAPPNVGARLPSELTLPAGTPARALVGPYGFVPDQDAEGFCTSRD